MKRTEFDVLVLETPESLFKSIDVGMECGIKRHVAGWGLPRNGPCRSRRRTRYEIVIGAATVRIPAGIDAVTLQTVLCVVKAAT